ncbi:hypothetical protein FQR65_LT07555 [Abscondita terminalis]|nr:hypothetical protein FQR65_LT07555 [Abscondita terminalis]
MWSLSSARVLAGISDGIIYPMVPVYIAETSDVKIRGFLITGIKIIYVVGIFLANLLGAFLSITNVVPESPYFYMIKGDDNKAKRSIQMFNNNSEIESIRNALNEQKTNGGKWVELFTEASNRKSLCLVIAMKLFEQFTGSMCFIFYSQTIFSETKSDVSSIVLISVYYVLQIVVLTINGMLIDKIGRRPLIAASAFSVVVSLLLITIYFTLKNVTDISVIDYSWCPVFGLFLFVIGFTLGLQNIPDLLVTEIFPLHVKSAAVSIFYLVDGLSTVAVSKLFQYTNDEFGMHVPFIIFSVCSLCGTPLFVFCVPETKKKTLEDIERSVRSKHGK